MNAEAPTQPIYRFRGPSGREALAPLREGAVVQDAATGEELVPVAVQLPSGRDSASSLPRAPHNLRSCRRCRQLTARDLAECEFCGLTD